MIRQLMKYFNIMSELIRDVLNYGVFSDRDFRSMLDDPNNPILLELATEFPHTLRYILPEFGCRSPLRRLHPDKEADLDLAYLCEYISVCSFISSSCSFKESQ